MVNCELCGTPLRAIGRDRDNGRVFSGNGGYDWDNRLYHKKCYKKILTYDNTLYHKKSYNNFIKEEIKKIENNRKIKEIKNDYLTITIYELDL